MNPTILTAALSKLFGRTALSLPLALAPGKEKEIFGTISVKISLKINLESHPTRAYIYIYIYRVSQNRCNPLI